MVLGWALTAAGPWCPCRRSWPPWDKSSCSLFTLEDAAAAILAAASTVMEAATDAKCSRDPRKSMQVGSSLPATMICDMADFGRVGCCCWNAGCSQRLPDELEGYCALWGGTGGGIGPIFTSKSSSRSLSTVMPVELLVYWPIAGGALEVLTSSTGSLPPRCR